MITWQDFEKVDMRVGTILTATLLENAKNPAYVITIDFGQNLGIKKSSAQITKLYDIEMLIGQQVIAVVNFPPKQIGKIISECLVLGLVGDNKAVTLLQPERKVDNGLRLM
jgi:tRNA-binding protein